jgi:hypothetical protein
LYFPFADAAQEGRRIPIAKLCLLETNWGRVGKGRNETDTAAAEPSISDLPR